jgi:hypothetical protein
VARRRLWLLGSPFEADPRSGSRLSAFSLGQMVLQ